MKNLRLALSSVQMQVLYHPPLHYKVCVATGSLETGGAGTEEASLFEKSSLIGG